MSLEPSAAGLSTLASKKISTGLCPGSWSLASAGAHKRAAAGFPSVERTEGSHVAPLEEEPLEVAAGEGEALKAQPEPMQVEDLRAVWLQAADASRSASQKNPSRLHRIVSGFIGGRAWLWSHFDDLFTEAWLGLDSAASAVENGRVENVDGYISVAVWNRMRQYVRAVAKHDDRKASVETTSQGFMTEDGSPVQMVEVVPSEELEAKWDVDGPHAYCIADGCLEGVDSSVQGKRVDALTCGRPRCIKRAQRGQVKAWALPESE